MFVMHELLNLSVSISVFISLVTSLVGANPNSFLLFKISIYTRETIIR